MIKRLLLAVAFCCAGFPALAQSAMTRAQLTADANAYITSNGIGGITGPILNLRLTNMDASMITLLDVTNQFSYMPTFPATGCLQANGASPISAGSCVSLSANNTFTGTNTFNAFSTFAGAAAFNAFVTFNGNIQASFIATTGSLVVNSGSNAGVVQVMGTGSENLQVCNTGGSGGDIQSSGGSSFSINFMNSSCVISATDMIMSATRVFVEQSFQIDDAGSWVAVTNCGSLASSTKCLIVHAPDGNPLYIPAYGTF